MDVDGQAHSSGSNGGSSDGSSDVVVVHIHFGMSGAFRTASLPGPDPTPTTRLRLVHEGTGLMAHLSAMTVGHGGLGLYREKVRREWLAGVVEGGGLRGRALPKVGFFLHQGSGNVISNWKDYSPAWTWPHPVLEGGWGVGGQG